MTAVLERMAAALERLAPKPAVSTDFTAAGAFVWTVDPDRLMPVPQVSRIDLDLLVGIDSKRDTLLDNTRRFAKGLSANNVLLWGARGTGKSSLIKAVHARVRDGGADLKLVELHREDLATVGRLMAALRDAPFRFLVFCDDLSFDAGDTDYKSLKALLDGGIEGRPANVLFYATSNRRHLMPRDSIENEQQKGLSPSEAVEEKVSLSDRFGLWLGFHPCTQADYLAMVQGYCDAYAVPWEAEELRAEAIAWQMARGARNGRVAWQFFMDFAGRKGVAIP